jgi:hypothetical protein
MRSVSARAVLAPRSSWALRALCVWVWVLGFGLVLGILRALRIPAACHAPGKHTRKRSSCHGGAEGSLPQAGEGRSDSDPEEC